MKIIDFFERAYVINLPSRMDRRKMIVQELKKAEMPLRPNKIEIFPAIRPDNAGGFPSIGVLGCFLSHLTILKRARDEGLANILIMEDDLKISEQFRSSQEILVDQLSQTDWGFVYFGHVEEVSEAGSPVTLQLLSKSWLISAHFYGVNGAIFDRLLSFLEQLKDRPGGHPDGGPMHLDGAYSTFRAQNPDIVTLIASPNLGWQRSSRSDITTAHWFDKLPVLKQLATAARQSKYVLKGRRK